MLAREDPCAYCDKGLNVVMTAGARPSFLHYFCRGCAAEYQKFTKCENPACDRPPFVNSLGELPGKYCNSCAKAGIRKCATRGCSKIRNGEGSSCDTCMVKVAESAASGRGRKGKSKTK
jgi:hypothetical protein